MSPRRALLSNNASSPYVYVHTFTNNPDRQLEAGALVAAVRALEALAHERTVAKLKLESDEVAAAAQGGEFALPYDPASVFLLETMVSIARQTPSYIEEVWYAFSP